MTTFNEWLPIDANVAPTRMIHVTPVYQKGSQKDAVGRVTIDWCSPGYTVLFHSEAKALWLCTAQEVPQYLGIYTPCRALSVLTAPQLATVCSNLGLVNDYRLLSEGITMVGLYLASLRTSSPAQLLALQQQKRKTLSQMPSSVPPLQSVDLGNCPVFVHKSKGGFLVQLGQNGSSRALSQLDQYQLGALTRTLPVIPGLAAARTVLIKKKVVAAFLAQEFVKAGAANPDTKVTCLDWNAAHAPAPTAPLAQ